MQQYKLVKIRKQERKSLKMRWAIYRIHYGLDYLEQSINSVIDWADHVIVCYSEIPYAGVASARYMGKDYTLRNPENVRKFLDEKYAHNDKVSYWQEEFADPRNQFRLLYEKVVRIRKLTPTLCLFIEPDMVFEKSNVFTMQDELISKGVQSVSTPQVELWKNQYWRVPQRDRVGTTMWNIGLNDSFATHFGTTSADGVIHKTSKAFNYNFGFCMNPESMLYKHLTALSFSSKIGDSLPSEEWYEEKWLNWTPETRDLEIARNYKGMIPKAIPYEMEKVIKEQLGYE